MRDPLLYIRNLTVAFPAGGGRTIEAVSQLDLTVGHGEIVALVGESGSGKTVTALSITGLVEVPPAAFIHGEAIFDGRDLLALPESALSAVRGGRIAYIFQEPATALNPVVTVADQILEGLRYHADSLASVERPARIRKLLLDVGLTEPERIARSYPHQLSGGQQQRVMMAMALAGDPELLIADEPTTALDVTVQDQILTLLASVQKQRGMAVLLITHNLAVAARLADRIVVMYAGQVVESGPARDVVTAPAHPYTMALLKAVPRLHGGPEVLQGIPGHIPSGEAWPAGCRFHPRCRLCDARCRTGLPPLIRLAMARTSRCFYAERMHDESGGA